MCPVRSDERIGLQTCLTAGPSGPVAEARAELERHRRRAEELGARLVLDSTDHEEPLHVLADPAGHPSCMLVPPTG